MTPEQRRGRRPRVTSARARRPRSLLAPPRRQRRAAGVRRRSAPSTARARGRAVFDARSRRNGPRAARGDRGVPARAGGGAWAGTTSPTRSRRARRARRRAGGWCDARTAAAAPVGGAPLRSRHRRRRRASRVVFALSLRSVFGARPIALALVPEAEEVPRLPGAADADFSSLTSRPRSARRVAYRASPTSGSAAGRREHEDVVAVAGVRRARLAAISRSRSRRYSVASIGAIGVPAMTPLRPPSTILPCSLHPWIEQRRASAARRRDPSAKGSGRPASRSCTSIELK